MENLANQAEMRQALNKLNDLTITVIIIFIIIAVIGKKWEGKWLFALGTDSIFLDELLLLS